MIKSLRAAIVSLLLLTLMTGIIYPLLITGIAQTVFAAQANGSVIQRDGEVIGSSLIGQAFDDPKYFWGRPSATASFANNSEASSGSNLGPLNPQLAEAVKARIAALQSADAGNHASIPIDLATASASGLDPHISPAAAAYQVPRVARLRSLSEEKVRQLVDKYTEDRSLGLLGERRVNVLKLNLALDDH